MNYIGLLDCNNFFVSCERLFRPDLVGKPVVVLSGNDGCVVARSNEVKTMGVPMGIPYFQVKKELAAADCAIFSSNFPLYRDISSRVMEVLREITPQVEQYSVDEAFFRLQVRGETSNLDVGREESLDGVLTAMREIKRSIEQRVGIPVSVGAAKTKTIAKYAADKEKRGMGVCVLGGENWQQESSNLPISTIWGVGAKTSIKMREHGIVTVSDFLAVDPARVDQLFGIDGVRKRDELSERSVYRLGDKRGPQQSIMSTRSFRTTTTEKTVIGDALAYHVTHAAEELRTLEMRATYLRVMVQTDRHGDWMLHGGTKELLLQRPTNDTRVLLAAAHELLDELYVHHVPYKKAGVVLGGLTSIEADQLDLFEPETTNDSAAVMGVMDAMNARFGKGALTVGVTKKTGSWQSSKDFVSPCYTTNWGEIPTIRTD